MMTFKNEKLKKLFNDKRPINQMSYDEMGLTIIREYIVSLMDIAAFPEVNLQLDFTYDTIKNLPVVLAAEFMVGMNSGYSIEKNIEIAEKTLASYLYFLAAEQHNIPLTVTQTGNLDAVGTFTGFEIKAKDKNLLLSAFNCVKYSDKKFELYISDICNDYMSLTFRNLKAYGLDDTQVVFG